MSIILRTLLSKSAYQTIINRYQHYRRNGTSAITAGLTNGVIILCWLFLKLESSNWKWVKKNYRTLFPHISLSHPKFGDVLRYLIQASYLILFYYEPKKSHGYALKKALYKTLDSYYAWINRFSHQVSNTKTAKKSVLIIQLLPAKVRSVIFFLFGLISTLLLLLCITQPFQPLYQFIFLMILWWTAMSIRHLPGRGIVIMLAAISLIVSCRYLWWRYTYTLVWNDVTSMIFGSLLLFAETYIWVVLVLGYFQSIWPLHREPVALPKDISTWPSVDIFITTYDEDLSILKPGVYACLGIDWPKDKMNIYILDDGRRPLFKDFAEEIGVNYIARPSNEHAKAGNINYALKHSHSDLIAIFDCDHIPSHSFLQLTVGWFLKDEKLAILQTPHHFFSPDPFERNLGSFQQTPNESALFYGVVQDGNDTWDASYFCGSSGILLRSALEEIGGFAVESVTEDAHTSLRLQRHGYTSAYIRIPLAAGLATESLSAHIGQRIRWARGMVQILRIDNPFLGKGLTLPQRFCYFNAMMHFLSGIPRLIFFISPVIFLVLNAYIIYASGIMIMLYAFPHIIHATITNSRIQGRYRHFLWNEIYETVMAWYIAVPTTVALINPKKGKFNVTAKGGLIEERYVDWRTARPYIVLFTISFIGLIVGIGRVIYGPGGDLSAVLISLAWVLYNLIILGGALGVDIETKQIRKSHRVEFSMPAALVREEGQAFPCILTNYSDSGVGIVLTKPDILVVGKKVHLILKHDQEEFTFPCEVTRIFGLNAGLRLDDITVKQHIDFIQCTFARADTWALWQNSIQEDKPIESLIDVFKLDIKGYLSIIEFTPLLIRTFLTYFSQIILWILSFAPHMIRNKPRSKKLYTGDINKGTL